MNNFVAFLIVPFSGFFIYKLPLSPVYVFLLIGGYFAFLYFFLRKQNYFDSLIFLPLALFFFTIIAQSMLGGHFKTVCLVLVSLAFYILSLYIVPTLSSNSVIVVSETLIRISLPLLICEAGWRLTHPIALFDISQPQNEGLFYYFYKMNSFMYQDSNFVGVFIVVLLSCVFPVRLREKLYISG